MSATVQVPIGGIIAWVKSSSGTPQTLPYGWAECNGQTLSDAQSVFNGQVIPNLNANGGGPQRFLRGSTSSGAVGGGETHQHSSFSTDVSPSFATVDANIDGTTSDVSVASHTHTATTDTVDHKPYYFEVVWIIRTK